MEPSPLYTADLFPPLYMELEALLRDLAPEDWQRQRTRIEGDASLAEPLFAMRSVMV